MVKIDKSFVDRLTEDAEGAALVRSVIELGVALGLSTIAEGVEQDAQLTAPETLGCDNVQGFVFDRPMPGDRFAEALTRRPVERRMPTPLRSA